MSIVWEMTNKVEELKKDYPEPPDWLKTLGLTDDEISEISLAFGITGELISMTFGIVLREILYQRQEEKV